MLKLLNGNNLKKIKKDSWIYLSLIQTCISEIHGGDWLWAEGTPRVEELEELEELEGILRLFIVSVSSAVNESPS